MFVSWINQKCEQILVKFGWKIWNDLGKKCLDFGGDPDTSVDSTAAIS